jgi:hypothetical protein
MAALSTAAARPRAVTGIVPRADATDPKAMVEALNRAFEEFKATNDAALKAPRPTTAKSPKRCKLDAINAEITKVTGCSRRPRPTWLRPNWAPAGAQLTPEAAEHSEGSTSFSARAPNRRTCANWKSRRH